MQNIGMLVLGLAAGVLSGVSGVGGGIIIVPALVYFFGYSMHQAQGTTLALLVPPIGILAAWAYYQKGYVDISAAVLIAAGFVAGSVAGAKMGIGFSEDALRKIFAVLLIGIAVKMLLQKA
jgi:uncharacterized membrane protein YfcA